jgi:hypothetical protein
MRVFRVTLRVGVDADEPTGSATICVAVLDSVGRELIASNLGDSGFLIIRPHTGNAPAGAPSYKGHTIAYSSPHQLVAFNCPYQLGMPGG